MSLRVMFLGTLPPSRPTIAGRTIPLARELRKCGHDAHLITLGYRSEQKEIDGVPVATVGPSLRDTSPTVPTPTQRLSRLQSGTRSLAREISKRKFDILVLAKPHPQNTYAAWKQSNQSAVILDADDDEIWGSRLTMPERIFMRVVDRRAAAMARRITACSPALINHYRPLHPKPAILIPTSINAHQNENAPNLRTTLGIDPDALVILYLGSVALTSGHRIDHLLDTWDTVAATHRNAHLVIAGNGVDTDHMKRRSSSLAHARRVHFTGRYNPASALSFARQATVIADPADRSPQAQAKSSSRVLYALMSGTPVIAAASGIRQHILPTSLHQQYLYDPNDLTTLADRLTTALAPEAAHIFRSETAGLWKEWSWDTIGQRFCSTIENL